MGAPAVEVAAPATAPTARATPAAAICFQRGDACNEFALLPPRTLEIGTILLAVVRERVVTSSTKLLNLNTVVVSLAAGICRAATSPRLRRTCCAAK